MTNRRFILGTAGHVDHGKTELVRALTGWDTDRLKEEKERGISIELGFAPLRLDDDTIIGIVDVPGHERFVKQMVAGAGGIDIAMLVVAGEEGVMPQTREHLEVLTSLSVSTGVLVISKSDLASEDMMSIVEDDIAELVEGTFFEGAPVVHTSARTNAGVDTLRRTLKELVADIPARDTDGPFRLAVDRVFHKQGIGIVITGSGYSGKVTVGDTLELLPSGKDARVRAVQSFGEERETGYAGERLAIALQGRKLADITRGEMLVAPAKFTAGYMLDARIHIADYAKFELKQRERVRIHHGAKEVLGRVVLLESEKLSSGDDALVQLRLETPIVASEGDYFVIRKYSPSRVFGGGRVIDPAAEKHKRFDGDVLDHLKLMESGDPKDKTSKAIETSGLQGLTARELPADQVERLVAEGEVVIVEARAFHTRALRELAERVYTLTEQHVKAHPLRRGIDKEELRQKVKFPHPSQIFNHVLETIGQYKPIQTVSNFVRRSDAESELSKDDKQQLAALEQAIKKPGLLFPRQADLEKDWHSKHSLPEALQYLRDAGAVVRIGKDGYMHGDALRSCLQKLGSWFDDNAELRVTDFKDLFAVTRKHAIPLLEHLDAEKITSRRGDTRVRGPRFSASAEKA